MKRLLLLFSLTIALFGFAQERCLTSAYLDVKRQGQTTEAKAIAQAEDLLQKAARQSRVAEETVIRIPVVVHVIYNDASQNISQAQIESGLLALNRDFRRKNADTTATPQQFRDLATDVQIEFYLATADPRGRPTTGIERKWTNRLGWMADDKVKQSLHSGTDAWDSRSYFNIWICNLIGGTGYASAPGSAAGLDGIVIHHSAFGTIQASSPFNMGRTAVHEAGHWLGLKHIWGDQSCGDDGIEDTPIQGFYTKGCPTASRSSCGNNATGDMYMNYMDYTNDACMNLFTKGQRKRMRANFSEGGPRVLLLQSKGLQKPWLQEAALPVPVATLFPNPAQDKITLQSDPSQLGRNVSLITSQGQLIRTERISSTQQSFDVKLLKPGMYFLKGEGFLYKFIKS